MSDHAVVDRAVRWQGECDCGWRWIGYAHTIEEAARDLLNHSCTHPIRKAAQL